MNSSELHAAGTLGVRRGDVPVKAIADIVGFASCSHFSWSPVTN